MNIEQQQYQITVYLPKEKIEVIKKVTELDKTIQDIIEIKFTDKIALQDLRDCSLTADLTVDFTPVNKLPDKDNKK